MSGSAVVVKTEKQVDDSLLEVLRKNPEVGLESSNFCSENNVQTPLFDSVGLQSRAV
jgi:hypothetical protein